MVSLKRTFSFLALVVAAVQVLAPAKEGGWRLPAVGDRSEKPRLVYIVGAVRRSGGYALPPDGKITLLQGLALAGGLDPAAATGTATIIRRSKTNARIETRVDIREVLKGRAPDIELVEDDILFVRNATKSVPKEQQHPTGPRDLPLQVPFYPSPTRADDHGPSRPALGRSARNPWDLI